MAITNSCAAGREMPYTSNNQSYIHDNSHGDNPKDRPRDIQNPGNIILPNIKYSWIGHPIRADKKTIF